MSSSSPVLSKSGYKKQGGTIIQVSHKWTGYQLRGSSSRHGSWSRITIGGKGNKKFSIFSAYRVGNNGIESAGSETIWMQEYNSQLQIGISDPDPRKQILTDLSEQIR